MAKKYGPLLFSHEVSYNNETFSEKVHTCLSPSLTSLAFILSPSHSFSLCFSLSLLVRQSLHQLKVEVSNTISIDTSFHLMRRLQTSLTCFAEWYHQEPIFHLHTLLLSHALSLSYTPTKAL